MRYFLFELKRAWQNFGLSMIILGVMPLIFYFFMGAFSLLLSGTWSVYGFSVISLSFVSSTVALFLSMPVKLYGGLTDRRQGSDYLMLPAPMWQKFASMMAIILVVAPIVYAVLFMSSSWLLALIDANFRTSISADPLSFVQNAMVEEGLDVNVKLHAYLFVFLEYVETILWFTLGAIFFKTAKQGKTFISLIAFGMVCSLLLMAFGLNSDVDVVKSDNLVNGALAIGYCFEVLMILLLGTGIWFRLKTLKH